MRQTQGTQLSPAWTPMASAGIQCTAAANACAAAVFRGFEAMRKVQEGAAREAASRHALASDRLRRNGTLFEVAGVQADLLCSDFEASLRYWQELGGAAMEMQSEMLNSVGELVDSAVVLETLSMLSGNPAERLTARGVRSSS